MTAPILMLRNTAHRLMNWKVRGIRWIDIIGGVAVACMILSVYVAKAGADRENRRISEIEREIAQNHQRVRLLRAEIARLEQPGRLEALSRAAGLEPVDVHRQATEAQLPDLGVTPEPVGAPQAATPDKAAVQ